MSYSRLIKTWLLLIPLIGMLSSCSSGIRRSAKSFDTVIIDAGHGGHDAGARSRRGTLEKRVNLDVARRVERRLRSAGFKTVMTRNSDQFISLGKRTRISNRHKKAIFVSIHHNHSSRRSARGVESFYYQRYSKQIANRIQRSILQTVGAPNRGVKNARFYVLRKNRNPAVLIECGFLSNSSEDRRIRTAGYREQMARQIANAIIEQRYGTRFPGSVTSPRYARN